MHEQNIVHGDLKPSNILVCVDKDSGKETVKVCDFGNSRNTSKSGISSQTTVSMMGTHGYIAPELYSNTSVDMSS